MTTGGTDNWILRHRLPTIRLETWIDARIGHVFDLARDLDVHARTVTHTRERAVGAKTTGKIEAGDVITFEARHLGVRQRLTSRITEFDPPHLFADEMTQGAFQSLRHRHEFREESGGTLMMDTLEFRSPLGPLGVLADRLFLERYMRRFLLVRNANLKAIAEAGQER